SMPVVDMFDRDGRVVKINAGAAPDDVFRDTLANLGDRLGGDFRK
ncbi:hypothetical protein IMZ48_17320, partial [Candidatus Bathyarchaeota archaeon]|nr:hypothetical protein [Candidatus Bathyarchaeota archaeon]